MNGLTPFITNVLKESGELVLSHFGSILSTKQKAEPSQVVTEVDVKAERLIINSIAAKFPEHSVLGEESGFVDKKSDYVWVIDPIDGTSNFANGIPWFGVMIALLQKATPIASGIYLPVTNQLYTAEEGKGAFRNGKLYKAKEDDLRNTLICLHFDPTDDQKEFDQLVTTFQRLIPKIRNLRTTNSVVDYAYVTEGKIGGLINFKNKIWDDVAVALIGSEAGCLITDHAGNPPDFSITKENYARDFSLVIATKNIHPKLLEVL